ncbi:hypothetical protein GP486_007479 [Trichoglossum hirsutum]|uniref:Uncharacterized protein n=1 Tax=Trichoglossum hirsutum TaxID=265104 RepID=A0A9P8L7L5_9PEZI|nr:hypothetical protein GP486_007479 [Trichoglossum hirsutum]
MSASQQYQAPPPPYSAAVSSPAPLPVFNQPPVHGQLTPAYDQPPPVPAYSNPVQAPQSGYPVANQQIYQPVPQHPQVSASQVSAFSGPVQVPQGGYPPEKQQFQQPLAQYAPPPGQQCGLPPGKLGTINQAGQYTPAQTPALSPTEPKDDRKSGKAKRFFGDTLVGRIARAGVASATNTLKMPSALSPWGDNNPVTLPNVRYRDAVLFTTFAFTGAPIVDGMDSVVGDIFGADSFISETVSAGAGFITGNTIVKYGVFQIVEQAIDKGIIEHILPEEEKIIRTTNVKTLQVTVKHKLMGVDADIRLVGVYPSSNQTACDKGWFCPYLFASARTPVIPRAHDFAIAQCFGPFLGGCNRMVILFTGISPYRSVWSTSRRPGAAVILFHLLDGCPALVIPVSNRAPICAWSPWTLLNMRSAAYRPEIQHEQICEYLDTIVNLDQVYEHVRPRYEEVMARSVSMVINGAINTKFVNPAILSKIDPERAGIVMYRY